MITGNDLLAEAKKRLSLSQIMAQFGFGDSAKKSACCPFHEDSSASFSVYVGNDGEEHWNCFAGCGQGDAIDFLAKHRGLSNADACREFIQLAGVAQQSPAPKPPPSVPRQSFDWAACVAALTPDHCRKLADWRVYPPKFVAWLHRQGLVGLFAGRHYAFPVHDKAGQVVGCHYRLEGDGSWRFHPAGTHTAPLVIGDAAAAKRVFVFESQWDSLATIGILNHHIQPLDATAVVATRGASNGRLIADICAPDAVVYAFPQNDEPGQKWLASVAANCGRKVFHVITPSPHKDINDWTCAGATTDDIYHAIAEAQPATATSPASQNPATLAQTVSAEEPDEPQTLPFPLDAMPVAMAGMIASVARCERVPVALPAVCALGVVSAAIGAGLEVASGPNRVTRGNIYLLSSAESGSGKSETFRIIAAPLTTHEQAAIEIWRQKTSPQIASEIRVIDKEVAALERKAAKAQDPLERERLRGELEFKLCRKDELTRSGAMPCIIAQDVTTERLAVLLRDHHETAFSASADARKLVDNLLGRYNPGKTTDESLYLSAYSGDRVRVDRQGRDAVVLNRPCLALCWFIQPDLLATLLDEQSLSASGFLPRLLICHTNAAPRRIEGEPPSLSESIRTAWANLIDDLLANFHAADKPFCITATPEAEKVFINFHNGIVDRRASDLADVGAFAARYAENAYRVGVVLHAAQWGSAASREQLSAETATNAVRLVEWFAASQLDILAKGRRTAAAKLEDEVLELIEANRQRRGQEATTAREVHRARIVSTPEAAKALLERMEAAGLLNGTDTRPEHGGKTTRTYRPTRNPVPE